MELASYQSSRAWNFELVFTFLESYAPRCFGINSLFLIHFIGVRATCSDLTAALPFTHNKLAVQIYKL
jgi:hypothetical protein